MKIAIVGTGVSGLVAAHLLHPDHDITVFEADARIGGHANTVDVDVDGRSVAVDTGFIVYNERNYPGFRALLERARRRDPTHGDELRRQRSPHRPRVPRLEPQHALRPAPQSCQSVVPPSARRHHALQPRGPTARRGRGAVERTRPAPRRRRVRRRRRGDLGRLRASRPVLARRSCGSSSCRSARRSGRPIRRPSCASRCAAYARFMHNHGLLELARTARVAHGHRRLPALRRGARSRRSRIASSSACPCRRSSRTTASAARNASRCSPAEARNSSTV